MRYQEEKYKSILEATTEEIELLKIKSESDNLWRPSVHIFPEYGLLNDPNGMAYYKGAYHVFHQWYPFGVTHGMKHWGHFTSVNMIDWKREEVALIPVEDYESHGVYSGTAIEIEGELYLYYTGNIKLNKIKRDAKQCLAILDKNGKIKKSKKNPVIDTIPDGYTGHIRDPKVFQKNGKYFMLLGAQRYNETGAFLIYTSNDGIAWKYEKELELVDMPKDFGYMWECPDYLVVDDRELLIFSPQGIEKKDNKFHNLFNVVYCIGKLNLESFTFKVEYIDELDRGFDFYAPQTMKNKEGKNMLMAWAGCGEFSYPTDQYGWAHCLTFPRELSIQNNKLCQKPIENIEKLCIDNEIKQGNLQGYQKIFESNNNAYYIKGKLSFEKAKEIVIHVAVSEEECFDIKFDKLNQCIEVDRSKMKHRFAEEYGLIRKVDVDMAEVIDVQILVDRSIVEIFALEGRVAFSSRIFPVNNSSKIVVESDKNIKYILEKGDLRVAIS